MLRSYLAAAKRLETLTQQMESDHEADLTAFYQKVAETLESLPEPTEDLLEGADEQERDLLTRVFAHRKGALSRLTRFMALLPQELRRRVGKQINRIRNKLVPVLKQKQKRAAAVVVDVTAPGIAPQIGNRHIVSAIIDEVCDLMCQLGFQFAEGPEVEDEWHNFVALNIPENHPARDDSDNFYITDTLLLRSQTSPVQIRYMEKHSSPIRIFAPGRVFRPDTVDASHYYMFHQVEGLWVDEGITFAHLKTVLYQFGKLMLGDKVNLRLRPSYFPFTEPSAEIDFSCFVCGGKGCPTCRHKGWLEMGGCGMVDPNVLQACNIDPEKYTGFAFGIGIDRIAMARYGINDIRLLFQNDERFLRQF